jgi:hypothetical protein
MKTDIKNKTFSLIRKRMHGVAYLLMAGVFMLCCCYCSGDHAPEPVPPTPEPTEQEPLVPEPPIFEPSSELTIPEDLRGTRWKLAGIVDMETGELKELEPKDCVPCYTLSFSMDNIVSLFSTSQYGAIFINSDNIPTLLNYMGVTEKGEGHLLVKALNFITSYAWEDNELKFFYQTDGKESYLLYHKLILPVIPENLEGTRWKLSGVVDVETGILRELEPKDCAECYTLEFDTDHTAVGRGVDLPTGIDLFDLRKYMNVDLPEANQDANYFRGKMISIESFTMTSEEMKLFYNDKKNYLLFKLIE